MEFKFDFGFDSDKDSAQQLSHVFALIIIEWNGCYMSLYVANQRQAVQADRLRQKLHIKGLV